MSGARELMTMSMDTERAFPIAPDDLGHQRTLFSTAELSMPCFVWAGEEQEVIDPQKVASESMYRGVVPFGSNIRELDQVTRLSHPAASNVLEGLGRLRVMAVRERVSPWGDEGLGKFLEIRLERTE